MDCGILSGKVFELRGFLCGAGRVLIMLLHRRGRRVTEIPDAPGGNWQRYLGGWLVLTQAHGPLHSCRVLNISLTTSNTLVTWWAVLMLFPACGLSLECSDGPVLYLLDHTGIGNGAVVDFSFGAIFLLGPLKNNLIYLTFLYILVTFPFY